MASPGPVIPVDPFAGIAWDNKLGALLVGGLVGGVLYGITCMQGYIYYERCVSDRWPMKTFVGALWALDTFDFAITGHILYWYLVTNFTNPLALAGKPVCLSAHVLVTCITNFSIRLMFGRRIWRLSNRNIFLTAGIVATSSVDIIVGLIITAKTLKFSTIADLSKESTLFYINFASGFGSDVYVAVVLCWYLARSRTGFNKRTDSVISVLMLYTINTDAFLGMILYILMPNNFIFIAFYLQLSKLYTNAYLATLNNRGTLRDKSDGDGIVSIHLSRFTEPSRGIIDTERTAYSDGSKTREQLAVMVETQVDHQSGHELKIGV
ncbi:hypothetical protein BV25DRAFT_1280187 [Artomyces pyxidatus]|uniref:Uncharacterized protein n=1 Tax=Artomyces pyxidatus TaxID=48021 RepID=A0ACB8TFB1_9AGAM|nr:hypothetical protein BV25DRAFT_1280187 [Artomyces pyxidatus]